MKSIQIPLIQQDGTTNWITITDRKQMEYHLIENNKTHFVQAEGTSSTTEPLKTILGDGTNQTFNDILDGTYKIPTHLPHLLEKYLMDMKRDNNIKQNEHPLIPINAIKNALKMERTNTHISLRTAPWPLQSSSYIR